MTTIGLLLLVAAVYCGVVVSRLDRKLRALLPSRFERRSLAKRPWPGTPFSDQIHTLILQGFPPHLRPHYHAERGAVLVGRLYLFLGLTWCCAMMGLTILAETLALNSRGHG